MISGSEAIFPNNVTIALAAEFAKIDSAVPVFKRPIRVGDPVQAWAIVPATWEPDNDSWEFRGDQNLSSPSLYRYVIAIQCFNQDMDGERGLAVATQMAGIARNILSRSVDVRVALSLLSHSEHGFTERFKKGYVLGQRFLSNEIDGHFLHLSTLEFLIETEVLK